MENILVSIRVRPLSKQETSKGNPWKLTPKSIALSSGGSASGQTYSFDRVFDPNSRTVDIYDAHTKKIISSALQGFNGTIFAYGQTSSGKTYTMQGTSEEPGIIPLAIQDVFQNIQQVHSREFLLRVSYMEIYNEEIKDLLAPENCKLQIHENFEKGIFVAGLREEIVASPEQVFALMALGEANRHVGQTNMNVHSSRSHAIFRMVIESRDKSQDQDDGEDREKLQNSDPVRVSHLNLVDLAGSERVAKTGAEGARLKEGSFINKSLMTLGNVINKLSEGIEKQGGHVPYRDSKLTRILQPALGGNARTVIICNLTPALVHIDESKGTLNFASRANRVTNCAKVNEIVTDAALLKRQKKEIAELRQKLQNQESPSEQFDGEILNLRNELLKTELERERMALELQEFQKVQAERERRIKEQEQKIENLSTMVINSAVDDREFDKRSKRVVSFSIRDHVIDERGRALDGQNNRRETWCARIQSGLPLLSDLERSPKKHAPKTPKTASSVFSLLVNRERSFGLPPPFEALMEEDEDTLTSSSFGFQESFSIDDDFTLPEPGPQSSVADRRRRASDEYTGVFEVEQQLSDLQGQYDTLQCNYVIKMNEKDSEIDKLKKELAHTQLNLSKSGKDRHKKVQGPGKRSKSLDGWQESESLATIKQLRAQVGNLETEKLYMERELQSLANQAREQNETSTQELEEVYEELNLAKKNCAKLESQLGMTLHGVQQLEMEKRENEVLYSQLSSALIDLKTELDDIRSPCGGLQSSIDESLQHLTIYVKSFQECVADARQLSALGRSVHQNNDAKILPLTSKAASYNLSGDQYVELDEVYGCDMVKKPYSDILRSCPNEQGTKAKEKPLARQDVQSLQCCVEDKLHQSSNGNESQVDDFAGTIGSAKKEELQSGDYKDAEIKSCYSVSVEQKPGIPVDFHGLQEEKDILRSAVDNLRMEIEHAYSEKQSLLLRQAVLNDELDNLKACLQAMEDEKRSLSEPNQKFEGIMKEHQSCKSPNSLQFPELVCLGDAADSQVPVEESLTRLEAQLCKLKDENSCLSVSFASARRESEFAAAELRTSALRQSALEHNVESLKVALQSVEEERQQYMRASDEVAEELGRLETVVEKLAIQLAAGFEKCDKLYDIAEISGANDTLSKFEGQVDYAIDELKSVCKSVEVLVGAVKQAASEEEKLPLSKSALSDSKELHHVKSTLQLVEDKNTSLTKRLEEIQGVLLKESAFSEELHQLKSSLQSSEDENASLTRRLEEIQGVLLRESAFSEELHQVKSSLQSVEDENISLKKRLEETQSVVQRVSALTDQLHHMKSSLRSVVDEKESLERRLEETQSELESRKIEVNTIASKIRFSRPTQNGTEEHEELSSLVSEVERLIQEKETLEERVDVLHADVRLSRKETDGLLSREASLEKEVSSLRLSLEEKEDDKKLWMKIGEERLVDIERQRTELLSTSKKHADAEEEISNLNSFLSEKLDEVDRLDKRLKAVQEEEGRLNKKLKDVDEEKNTLVRTADELDNQLQAFRTGASEALKEMEGWQQRYQTESTHYRAEITSLRKELSAAKSLSGSSTKERDGLHRDLEKTKSKMKDVEAKLKTTIQDKNKLETEKLNMERELKQLRQSTLLQRDISRRDSMVDQRRQSIALGVNKTKSQLSSVEHALQLKTEELENLSYEVSRSHESYAKLEFAMAEAESYSNEKVSQLEEALATLKDEKDAAIARIQNDVDAANEQLRAKSNELETLRVEFVDLTRKLQEIGGERNAATARATAVTKEKEEIVEGLLDAHISFERQKAELTIEAREHREKCNLLNKDIVLLTEELDKLKKLREEASDGNRLLQDQLKEALEDNTEKSLTHYKLVKDLEAHVESYKEQCRELQQQLESAEKQAHDLRFSGSQQLEELRLELQQYLMKLSIAKDEEQMLLTENRSLLVANTKLQFALDASRDRLEIFETRWDESDWELTEFKSLLQKAGFVKGEQWNLASLQQFAKRVKAQNNEARRLETELASKKMEMIDLEVNLETTRSQCDKYQEEIQYLKTKVLTPEQETGVREIVLENKKVKAQLTKTEEKAQELRALVKGKEVSLNSLQATLGSIDAHNAKLQIDLAATKAELESLQQLHNIAMRAVAIGKSSTMSSSKPVRPEKLEPKATSQSTRSLPSNLFQKGGSPVSRAESACTESIAPEYRVPLCEKPLNDSPPITERKRARLFPASERSKLSRSMALGPLYFTLPQSRSQVDLNKENFTLH